MYSINDIYELAFCVVLIALAWFCHKMFRNMFTNLKGGNK